MAEPAIIVKNLGKRFMLGPRVSGSYRTLRDSLTGFMSRSSETQNQESQEFWALRELEFEVGAGEVLGVIGRNGAGKSTLLKILSRITEPTTGRVELHGRLASLLEVGTGFHPELSGRENIYLNGAILGMKRQEVRARFDEIVAFAEIERFLDTPVKRYSSGMYVRLAFAVAAHLEPEILIVDEVLAVGDIHFQKKCLGRMQTAASKEGRTVLLVSHQLSMLRQLATRCLLLEGGRLIQDGPTAEVIEAYAGLKTNKSRLEELPRLPGCMGGAKMVDAAFIQAAAVFRPDEELTFTLSIQWEHPMQSVRLSLTIATSENSPVGSGFSAPMIGSLEAGKTKVQISVPPRSLAPGRYAFTLAIGQETGSAPVHLDAVSGVLAFEIVQPEASSLTPLAWPSSWGAVQFTPLEVLSLS